MESKLVEFYSKYKDVLTPLHCSRYNILLRQTRQLPKLYSMDDRAGRNLLYALQQNLQQFYRQVEYPSKQLNSDYENYMSKAEKTLPCFSYLSLSPTRPPTLFQLRKLSFPTLSYKKKELVEISAFMLKEVQSHNHTLELVHLLCQNYNSVSYHNFSHAFSLQLLLHQMWARSKDLSRIYTPFEQYTAQIAALAHDLGHRGTNSIYEIKQTSQLAVTFNNDSVLENMHISILFKILRNNQKVDFLSKLPSEEQSKAKKRIVSLILSTDMAKHHQSLAQMAERVEQGQLDLSQEEDKECVLEMMFHGCDIGNPCFEYKEYLNWAVLLAHEFNEQAEMEEQMGLTVTPFLKFTSNEMFLKGQLAFIKGFSLPIWKQITCIFPSTAELYENILKNIQSLQK